MMVSQEMVEAAARADASYAGRTFDALASSDKVRFTERAKFMLEAALSTDAEPVEWRSRHSAQENWYYSDGARSWWECQPLYAAPTVAEPVKTAPAVAVKDGVYVDREVARDIAQLLSGSMFTFISTKEQARKRGAELYDALSAQVQDVAEASPAEYMRRHDAAIAAYEANTPSDSRYSALALRKAVDAAFAVAASPASKHGGP